MSEVRSKAPGWVKAASIVAIVFGLMTIISGGSVLFIESARRAAGDYVPFVLWFNFLAGFMNLTPDKKQSTCQDSQRNSVFFFLKNMNYF